MLKAVTDVVFPVPLDAYPSTAGQSLTAVLNARIEAEPFNLVAAVIFLLAILHTFLATPMREPRYVRRLAKIKLLERTR